MPSIMALLNLQFPGWTSEHWGKDLFSALKDSRDEKIFTVWAVHVSCRPQMAALVGYVLELLDKTGKLEDGLVAGFLHDLREVSVTFEHHRNDWTHLLRDTHLMATYAVVGGICIECETANHTTAVCGDQWSFTALDTRLGVRDLRRAPRPIRAPDYLKLEPEGHVLKVIDGSQWGPRSGGLYMTAASSTTFAGAYVLSSLANSNICAAAELRDLSVERGGVYDVIIRSSIKAYGGMETARKRTLPQVLPTAGVLQETGPAVQQFDDQPSLMTNLLNYDLDIGEEFFPMTSLADNSANYDLQDENDAVAGAARPSSIVTEGVASMVPPQERSAETIASIPSQGALPMPQSASAMTPRTLHGARR